MPSTPTQKSNPAGIFLYLVPVTILTILLVYGSSLKKQTERVPETAASDVQSTSAKPLTRLTGVREVWQVKSDFEMFEGNPGLWVAQGHKLGEHESVNRLLFFNTGACAGRPLGLPPKGQRLEVELLEVRMYGMLSIVADKGVFLPFVRPPCR